MKKAIVLLVVVSMAFVSAIEISGQEEAPDELGGFMQVKLRHSQELLEGLVTEDFEAIAKHSQELALLSQATNWRVLQT